MAGPALAGLRQEVRRLERNARQCAHQGASLIGLPEIDAALPARGLQWGALHQIEAASSRHIGAASGFLALLLGRLTKSNTGRARPGPILWCRRQASCFDGQPYPPGLLPWFDPARLYLAQPKNEADILWAVEEGLRAPGLAAVVGEVRDLHLTASRRLMLAAEQSGVPVLLLHQAATAVSAAATRWRIEAAPSVSPHRHLIGKPRWRIELLRARGLINGGAQASGRNLWTVEWNHETGDLALAAAAGDRPAGQPGAAEQPAGAALARLAG